MYDNRLDESPQFILPHISLTKLAHHLPRSTADLFRLLQPVPAIIRSHAREVVELVGKGLEGVSLDEEQIRKIVSDVRSSQETTSKPSESNELKVENPLENQISKSETFANVEEKVLDEMVKEGAKQLQGEFHRKSKEK